MDISKHASIVGKNFIICTGSAVLQNVQEGFPKT